jgi:hypothetical protein
VSVRGLTVTDVGGGTAATVTTSGVGNFNGGIVVGNTGSANSDALIFGDLSVADASYQRLLVNNNTGKVNIGNSNIGAGGTPGIDIYTAGLTPPSISLDGVTGKIELVDTVTGASSIKMEPQTGVISILPQGVGDPGLYLSPNGAQLGNSVGSFSSAGLAPCAVKFNGSAGASLQTAQNGFPVQLWAGGTNLIGSPQVSVTGTATTITNQLIASSLSYPTTDGVNKQVISTNGAGGLGWLSTARLVGAPASSVSPGSVGDIAIGFVSGTSYFFWHDGGQWWRVAGSSF